MDRVWFVDDLPENLEKFRENHGAHFAVTTFDKPDQVYQRISNNEYPDALLIDIFFYDSVDEARRVEKKVGELAEALQKTAFDLGLADHKYAAGITLIEQLYQHFGNARLHFRSTLTHQKDRSCCSTRIGKRSLAVGPKFY
jgi:phosphorylcholine metabolism protein LicD